MSELPSSPESIPVEVQNPPTVEKPIATIENREIPKPEQPAVPESNEINTPLPPVLMPDKQPVATATPQYSEQMVHKGVHVNKYAKFATTTFREFQRKLAIHYQNLRNTVRN